MANLERARHFHHRGKDAYPLIDKWIEEKADKYWRTWDGMPTEVQTFEIGDTPSFVGAWWHHVDLESKKSAYGGFDSEIG